jgi:uncharacterized protein GlcG (DUF336 family)
MYYFNRKLLHLTRRTLILNLSLGGALLANTALAGHLCNALGLGNQNAINATLTTIAQAVSADKGTNGGLGNHMWLVLVDQDGRVCGVAFSGGTRIDQWPASRVIAAQKSNTAQSLSLPTGKGGTVDALSTANLWAATQPGGSLWGLQHSNPVDTAVAYGNPSHQGGNANRYGTPNDPLIDSFIGGINVFGGGLALYNRDGQKVGAIGASGDTSCADHNVAWRARDRLGLDFVPSGLSAAGADDNIIYDVAIDATTGHGVSTSGFGHPDCRFGEPVANAAIIAACPTGDGATAGCL